ncbi:hypothetical protein D3C75_1310240 [compost metagenome]
MLSHLFHISFLQTTFISDEMLQCSLINDLALVQNSNVLTGLFNVLYNMGRQDNDSILCYFTE